MVYSGSVEEYLKTLGKLGAKDSPVALTALARQLQVSPVAAHEMVKKLADEGLVTYQPYKGVQLTPAGVEVAGAVLQRHRLWERFLHDVLGMPWDQVHHEAGRLEHETSPEVARRLSAFLDNPAYCPHGYPIEEPIGERQPSTLSVTELNLGERAIVVSVPEDQMDLLIYLGELGLRPQAEVEPVEVAPFDGPITLRIGDRRQAISRQLATQIMVQRV